MEPLRAVEPPSAYQTMEPPSTEQAPPRSELRRSATSACVCIVEGILSTIVCVYAWVGFTNAIITMDLQFFPSINYVGSFMALFCANCGVVRGLAQLFSPSRVQEAVGQTGWATFPGLDGVNPFEYHDVVTTAVGVTTGICSSSLMVILWVGFFLAWVFAGVLVPPKNPLFFIVFSVLLLLWACCMFLLIVLYKRAVLDRFEKFREACLNRPSYPAVRALLVVSSALYALVLCVPLMPSLWRWGLITTHTARAIKVYASLEGQTGVVQAHGEFSGGDMLKS